jgi:regulation of enolase protein 1 (concanavalin A-like superfamily)
MHAQLSALPMPLAWQLAPTSCRSDEVARLTVQAPAKTDMFVDPSGTEAPVLNAPRLLGVPPDPDFQLAARVTVGFGHTFDAGVLLVWVDERTWAKLCFERSPQGRPMAVTVVTRGSSDDANAFAVDGNQLWLRVSRVGGAWLFHASTDGAFWHFVRYFTLGAQGTVDTRAEARVGFEAQSPTGPGCEVTFDQITYRPERLPDLRSGV